MRRFPFRKFASAGQQGSFTGRKRDPSWGIFWAQDFYLSTRLDVLQIEATDGSQHLLLSSACPSPAQHTHGHAHTHPSKSPGREPASGGSCACPSEGLLSGVCLHSGQPLSSRGLLLGLRGCLCKHVCHSLSFISIEPYMSLDKG